MNTFSPMFRLFLLVVLLGIAFCSAGCGTTPYVEYQHYSDPHINNDGYDYGCLGTEYKHTNLAINGGVCDSRQGAVLNVGGRYYFNGH